MRASECTLPYIPLNLKPRPLLSTKYSTLALPCIDLFVVVVFDRIEYEDGIRREYEILTQSVHVWHVSEFTRRTVEEESHGQFHDEDAYVVSWHYAIMQS